MDGWMDELSHFQPTGQSMIPHPAHGQMESREIEKPTEVRKLCPSCDIEEIEQWQEIVDPYD